MERTLIDYKMIYINDTKKTNQAIKIGICYNDEEGFLAIQKIITLFKYLNINSTFLKIDAGNDKYIKGCNNGIEECDLMSLKNINLLIHTKFNLNFLNEKIGQKNISEYLEFSLNIIYKEIFYIENNSHIKTTTQEAFFLTTNKQYIEYNFKETKNNNKNDKNGNIIKEVLFSFGIGKKIIGSLYEYKDWIILNFAINLLKKISCTDVAENFSQICKSFGYKYEQVLEFLKKNQNKYQYKIATIDNNIIDIKYKKELVEKIDNFPDTLILYETKLGGLFSICKLVSAIKNEIIKICDENLELFEIYSCGYEVYPNLFYWDELCTNPLVKLKDKNK